MEKMNKMELLKKAQEQLPKENNIGVLEELAKTYSDLGSDTGEVEYYQKAISVFNRFSHREWEIIIQAINLSVLYQNIGDYDSAEKELTQI